MLYAVGQGSLAVQIRETDTALLLPFFAAIHDPSSVVRAVAERAFLGSLEGGCSVPIGVSSKVTLLDL